MGLPYTFGRLGYAPGITILTLFGILTFYSGILLWRLHMSFPSGITYGDLAEAVAGRPWKYILYAFVYCYFSLCMASYLLTVARSLQTMFWMYDVCLYWYALAALGFVIPLCQLRTLHLVSYAGFVSILMILLVIMIIVFDAYATWGDRAAEDVKISVVGQEDWQTSFASLTNLVFAYGGQGLYLEVMAEMKNPADFKKSLYCISSSIVIFYLWSSISLYFRYGDATKSDTLYNLEGGALKTVASLLMYVHVCVSFCLISQIINRAIHVRIAHTSVNKGDRTEKLQWFAITVTTSILAFLVANVIPFFSDLNGIISALCTGPLTYGFPALLYTIAATKAGRKISIPEWILHILMMIIAVGFCSVGTVTNVMKLIDDWSTFGGPFSCILDSE